MTTPEELRALVAEKVMGWIGSQVCLREALGEAREVWVLPTVEDGQVSVYKHLWNPLESWADAGRVIERMGQLGYCLDFHRCADGPTMAFFQDEVERYEQVLRDKDCEAISLAALRALGVEVE